MFKFVCFCTFLLIFVKPAVSTCPQDVVVPNGAVSYGSAAYNITCNSGYGWNGGNQTSVYNAAVCMVTTWSSANGQCLPNTDTTTAANNVPVTTAVNGSGSNVSAVQSFITCATLVCKNNGSCQSTGNTSNAVCSCVNGFTGLYCEQVATHSVDLNYLRSLSQNAYYTQQYWVDWSQYSVSGDQLKIAMSCSIIVLGALMATTSYYMSKSMMPPPTP